MTVHVGFRAKIKASRPPGSALWRYRTRTKRIWSTWSAVISLTSRAGELRSAPSGPDDRDRVAGKRALGLAPGVRVRRERAVK